MQLLQATCELSGEKFSVSPKEQDFLRRFNLPYPRLCYRERSRRRLSFRNELHLHRRKCDKTGRPFISIFRPDIPHKVYSLEAWWQDDWDPLRFGRDFDFSRPFFEQFDELFRVTPLPGTKVVNCTNCEYTYAVVNSRDCYLSYRVSDGEGILYCYLAHSCKDCFDSYNIFRSQYCYECIRCRDCYECFYSELSENCSGLFACYNLRGCKDCIGCSNLFNKQQCIFNEPVTPQEFADFQLKLRTQPLLQAEVLRRFDEILLATPRKALIQVACEDSYGDYLYNCARCLSCFESRECEDCLNQFGGVNSKDCMDTDNAFFCEKTYDCLAPGHAYNSMFCFDLYQGSNQLYTASCYADCKDLFGCVSLRKRQYCILNKQYDQTEYETLRGKIISHMQETGEWGEFFPSQLSPFPYNESTASVYYPLNEYEITARGLTLSTPNESEFRLTKEEQLFYQRYGLAAPKLNPLQRQLRRFANLNPYRLFERRCSKSGAEIDTSYPPDSPLEVLANPVFCQLYET